MGKTGSTGKTMVTEYRMSMHMALCHGPVDELLEIKIGDKTAWTGTISSTTAFNVNKPDLFGGILKEGGVAGRVVFLSGDPDQILNAELAGKLGGTPTSVPGFRGFLSIFFLNLAGTRKGFYWGANTPYVKNASFRLRRSPKGFYPEKAMIGPDANPAHMIYECLTNGSWGMGGSPGQIDAVNFTEVADALHAEGMGLSMLWSGQSTIESFVQEILDHIEATFFTNPRTGLFNIKLIRPDYVVSDLFHINDDNAVITKFQRKGWGETVNEINATWTNPENEQEENVTVHDLGNIASQGEIVPSSRNYYGARNAQLATRMAQRDLTASAYPIASCEARVSRAAWTETPGKAVRVSSSAHSLSELVMRVGRINYGRQGSPDITVTLMEDVFSLPENPYVDPPDTEWEDPAVEPAPLAYSRFFDIPYYVAARALGDGPAEDLPYPQTYVGVLGAQNVAGTLSIDLLAEGVNEVGTVAFRRVGEIVPAGRGILSGSMVEAVSSTLPVFSDLDGNVGLEISTMIMLMAPGHTGNDFELILVTGVTSGVASVRRGILDTVPRAWPAGTEAWLFRPASLIYDLTARAAGQTVSYKLLPRTTLGLLAESDASEQDFLMGDRLHRPLRPANVKVNGTLFGPATLDYATDGLTITWSHRNRLTETSQIAAWGDSSVTPEAGQTVRVTIYDGVTILEQVSGITGTSFTASFSPTGLSGHSIRYVVESFRDGLPSLQAASKTMTII